MLLKTQPSLLILIQMVIPLLTLISFVVYIIHSTQVIFTNSNKVYASTVNSICCSKHYS